MTITNGRTPGHDVDPLFVQRWSPRAFSGEPITETQLHSLLEAARWAPSAFNLQPWRFAWARRDTPHWDRFVDVLLPFNQVWARNAGALIIVASDSFSRPEGQPPQPSHSHSFDTGAAWGNLALQAVKLGLISHGMLGFDQDKARAELGVPAEWRLEAAVAVGHPGDPADLPEKLRAREVASDRNPVSAFAFEGGFPAV